jgi:hypothetical protein
VSDNTHLSYEELKAEGADPSPERVPIEEDDFLIDPDTYEAVGLVDAIDQHVQTEEDLDAALVRIQREEANIASVTLQRSAHEDVINAAIRKALEDVEALPEVIAARATINNLLRLERKARSRWERLYAIFYVQIEAFAKTLRRGKSQTVARPAGTVSFTTYQASIDVVDTTLAANFLLRKEPVAVEYKVLKSNIGKGTKEALLKDEDLAEENGFAIKPAWTKCVIDTGITIGANTPPAQE